MLYLVRGGLTSPLTVSCGNCRQPVKMCNISPLVHATGQTSSLKITSPSSKEDLHLTADDLYSDIVLLVTVMNSVHYDT